MPRALFVSKNLIGDGMNIYPALKTWWNEHQDGTGLLSEWEIDFETFPDWAKPLYEYMGLPMRVFVGEEKRRPPYDFEFTFDCNKAFQIGDRQRTHIALAYCQMLGVQVKDADWRLKFDPPAMPLDDREKGLILISPFSKSCSSQQGYPPNKMLPWEKWKPLLRYLRRLGPIGVLGAEGDRAPELELPEGDYLTGLPLERVAHILKASKLVVTIDNGVSHLAASQKAKTILFYPACLAQHWITPINPNLAMVIQLDPNTVEPGDLVMAIKQKLIELSLFQIKP